MERRVIEQIVAEFKEAIPRLFGAELRFAFICGGFAKGYADQGHDVDTFICVDRAIEASEERYLDWYFDLHERYGLLADEGYPGELVTWGQLISTLAILRTLKLELVVADVQVKKAIIWGDMLAGRIVGETGRDLAALNALQEECRPYPERWKAEVLELLSPAVRDAWKNKHQLLLMERFMVYPRHDRRRPRQRKTGNP